VLDKNLWGGVPFHFWTAVFFVLGSIVGSFLNVCIHRMPLEQSVIRPPSHCPHCKYSIPWFLNIPLVTWVYLRGKCASCGAPISIRYFLVELLTAVTFAGCWLAIGHRSPGVAVVYCLILAGFIAATFIDVEHIIIPDEITIGGIIVGFLLSAVVPELHNTGDRGLAMKASFWGIAVGGGIVYLILRGGKLAFGKEKLQLAPESKVIFKETALQLPDKELPYNEIFYRKSDYIQLFAKTAELADRCYFKTIITLKPDLLKIGEEELNPEQVPHMEIVTNEIVLPREAMGFGDVKFMAAIGAFLGWQAVIFSLMVSAVIGTAVSLGAIAIRRAEWSTRIPYGPYIALAAVIYMFLSFEMQAAWRDYLSVFTQLFNQGPAAGAYMR
ncbi:MAG TPA: prepilin peptidase, partial [Verrucomicrobiae bacterium]|nr:prepilin peptidase [Verrucomicrobiae bacterium]